MTAMRGMMISRTVRRVSSPGLKTLEVMMRVMMVMMMMKRQILMKMERARVKQEASRRPPRLQENLRYGPLLSNDVYWL